MKSTMIWWTSLLLSMLLIATTANPPAGEICNSCNCSGVTVSCDCFKNKKMQHVFIEENSLTDTSNLEKFEVLGCQSLTLLTNAFRNAHVLKTVHVNKVENASFDIGVFHSLESLIIDSVSSLILKRSAFQGAKGINAILIRNSSIPVVPQWALFNITDLHEFRMERTHIKEIEKHAVMIDMYNSRGSFSIKECTFGRIKEEGVVISNANLINMSSCFISEADAKSIKLSSRQFMVLKKNTFEKKVHVDSMLIQFTDVLDFSDNVLKNVDIGISEHANKFLNQTSYNLDRMVFEKVGNQIPCECPTYVRNESEPFFQNLCIGGCEEATIHTFLAHCGERKASAKDILKDICRGKVPLSTPAIPTAAPIVSTTAKSSSSRVYGSGLATNFLALFLGVFLYFKK